MTSCKTRTTRSRFARVRSQHGQSLTSHSYDFEYEDDDEQEEGGDVDVENKYYNAKQIKADDPEAAIEEFLGVPALEQEKGDWGFKGLKQAIKLEFSLGKYEQVSGRPSSASETANGVGRLSNTTQSCSPMSNLL